MWHVAALSLGRSARYKNFLIKKVDAPPAPQVTWEAVKNAANHLETAYRTAGPTAVESIGYDYHLYAMDMSDMSRSREANEAHQQLP
eukprot:s665_g8.t1